MFETLYSWNAGIKDNKYTFVKEAYAGGSMTNFIMEIAGLVTLVQDCSISIANAHEILQSYTKPSKRSQASLFEPRFLSQGCIFGKYSLAKGIFFFRSP